jgi:hypothetical protein
MERGWGGGGGGGDDDRRRGAPSLGTASVMGDLPPGLGGFHFLHPLLGK